MTFNLSSVIGTLRSFSILCRSFTVKSKEFPAQALQIISYLTGTVVGLKINRAGRKKIG